MMRPAFALHLNNQLVFHHLSTRDGLTQNSISSMAQDKQGFLWFGNQSGLQKYDGYQFQTYQHNPLDETSISSGVVSTLYIDEKEDIWAGLFPNKVSVYLRNLDQFKNYNLPSRRSDGFIKKIISIKNHVWVVTVNELFRINTDTNAITKFNLDNKTEFINISKDNNNNLWVTSNDEIFYINGETGQVKSKFTVPKNYTDSISAALPQANTIWLGTKKGEIISFDKNNQQFHPVYSIKFEDKTPFIINQIIMSKEYLWISSSNQGLVSLHLIDKNINHYQHKSGDDFSLKNNKITSIFIDQSQLIWVGTSTGGVDRAKIENNYFHTFREKSTPETTEKINNIRDMLYLNASRIALATNSGSIKFLNQQNNSYQIFRLPEKKFVIQRNFNLATIIETDDKKILYGSRYGLWEFNPTNDQFKEISVIDNHNIDGGTVFESIKDKNGKIWLGSYQAGVGLYDFDHKKVTWFPVPEELQNQISNLVISMTLNYDNNIWVGTARGLALFDTSTGEYQIIKLNKNSDESILIRSLYLSPRGTLWVGTLSGLYSIENLAGKWSIKYPFPDVKPLTNNIYDILSDRNGKLWISTNKGIIKFNPDTHLYYHFTMENGLQGDEFNGNTAFKSPDGRFWFAGSEGINTFYPEAFQKSDYLPKSWISSYQINDQKFEVKQPDKFKQLTLKHNTELLKLSLSSMDYYNPKSNQFKIRTNQNEKKWIELGQSHEIIYSHFDFKELIIDYMGSNHDGVFNPDFNTVKIVILPPWWQSDTAYLIYFIIILILFFCVYQFLNHRRIQKAQELKMLNETKQQLDWALWGSGDAFWIWDLVNGDITRKGLDKMLGYQEGDVAGSGAGLKSIMHPDDIDYSFQLANKRVRSQDDRILDLEYRLKNSQGKYIWIHDRGKFVEFDDFGNPVKMAGTFRNISANKKIEFDRKLSDLIIQNMAEMVMVTDENFRIKSANPAFCYAMGYQQNELIGRNPSLFNSKKQTQQFYDNARDHLIKFGHWQGEMYQTTRTGTDLLQWVELISIKDNKNNDQNYIMVGTDITDKKRSEEELRKIANYDVLTALPNRILFQDRLNHAILKAARVNSKVALLFIDLDQFKHVNDSLGHVQGDEVLKQAANILSESVRKDDTVSRLGGDEFTVILENINRSIAVVHVCEKIIQAFSQPILIGEKQISITPSIGVSIYPDDADNGLNLLKFSDTAMYVAKEQGRNQFKFYAREMNKNAIRRMEVENKLRNALEKNEFYLVYQPIVLAKDKCIHSFEVLIRWNNPDLGLVNPDEFIPLAEEIGIINKIGEWVLETACSQASIWHQQGYDQLKIAINLSPLQFKNYDLCPKVSQILEQYNFPPQCLTLEITESLVMDNIDMTKSQLEKLQEIGIGIAIDDFGTGYSSLSYLKQFPLNSLKIDRTFIQDIITDPDDASLTLAIIAMSHQLGLSVTAEGVESEEQFDFLQQAQCETIQGFLISKPLTDDKFEEFLSENSFQKMENS